VKLFFDSNIWVSAFGTKGICRDLVRLALQKQGQSRLRLFFSAQVAGETERVLRDKFRVTPEALAAAQVVLSHGVLVQPQPNWQPAEGFPDPDDAPIVAAALAAGADLFVTGDKALLALGAVGGMPIVDPRTAYLRLRGLG
jgi:putative PIN family toxin of toxin-antitoxin system